MAPKTHSAKKTIGATAKSSVSDARSVAKAVLTDPGIVGQVSGHRDGYGFLLRDDRGPDVVLRESEMKKILHGDRVRVRLTGVDRRGRPEGEIIEVLERRTQRLVGRFVLERHRAVVIAADQRISQPIVLVRADDRAGAKEDQIVMVELITQPQGHGAPTGRITEILGDVDDPGMEIEVAVRKFGVPHTFPAEVIEAAKAIPATVQKKDLKGRVDLRDIDLVTIDGEDARDFDDAVYCQSEGRKGWRLLVAIADVDHYVNSGSVIDREAQARSTSVYFPRRVIPMLPEELSNGLCSLNPDVERLVMVCDMTISLQGAVKGYQFYPAVMHSAARLTYNEVWESLSNPASKGAQKLAPLMERLVTLYELYLTLARARVQRGALDLETTETQIIADANGRIQRIVARQRNDAHRLIEECMLAANVCAADFLARKKQMALVRVHEGPTPAKLEALRNSLKTLSLSLGGGEDPSPQDYAKLLQHIRARPDWAQLQIMVLRSMQQAQYSPHNAGHFGLAYEAYTHFTSPIRRYPDLLVHRAIKAVLNAKTYVPQVFEGPAQQPAEAAWENLGLHCSTNERRADDASRDVEAWLKCQYMKDKVGDVFSGTVSGVAPFGMFITLDDLFVEGAVHISELGADYFQFSEAGHELRGQRTGVRYRLGDRVTVQIARVDLDARRIEFRLVKEPNVRGAVAKPELKKARPGKAGESVEERRQRQAKRAERLAARRAKPASAASDKKSSAAKRGKRR